MSGRTTPAGGPTLSRRGFLTGLGGLAVTFSFTNAVVANVAPAAGVTAARRLRVTRPQPRANEADGYLLLTPAGITIYSGKVELGTGVQTALTQIVLEELRLPWREVTFIQGDTIRTPNEGGTVGSKTIQNGGPNLRRAAATAYQAILDLAASHFGVAKSRLHAKDGSVFADGRKRGITYEELLANADSTVTSDATVPLAAPADYKVVGRRIDRVDLPAKTRTTFTYIQDVTMPGMLHARVIRPSGRNATFSSFDQASLARAATIPGFRQVVREGTFVAVVADTEFATIQAAAPATGVRVNWSAGRALAAESALADELRSPANHYRTTTEIDRGDVDGALASAGDRVVAAQYLTPYQMHASMAPSCGVADVRSEPDPDTGVQVTVWTASQNVYALRGAIGSLLGLPAADAARRVHVVYTESSGCYGHNGADDASADAVLVSRAVGAPVRVQWSRQNEHQWEPVTPAMAHDMQGVIENSRVVAWDHRLYTPTHNSRPNASAGSLLAGTLVGQLPPALSGSPTNNSARNAPVEYEFPNDRLRVHLVRSFDTGPTAANGSAAPTAPLTYRFLRSTALRSLGGFSNSFANESFLDELAHAAAVDPLDVRVASLSDPRAIAVLEALRPSWDNRPKGGNGVGAGIAFQRYENENAYVAVYVAVAVDGDGVVKVTDVVVAHDCGLIVNPDGLENQIEGNVIQGISRTLKEQVAFDGNGVTSSVWQTAPPFNPGRQYTVLRFNEVPRITTILIDRPDQPAWGAGEPTIGAMPGAIGNAVFAATGKRVRTLPMTPDRLAMA